MALDKSTELIAHFIGIFEQFEQAARMRQGYEEFRAHRLDDPDMGAIQFTKINVSSPYAESSFAPDLSYKDQWSTGFGSGRGALTVQVPPLEGDPVPAAGNSAKGYGSGATKYGYDDGAVLPPIPTPGTPQLTFDVPPPSAQANIAIQINGLSDNDMLFNVDTGATFLAPNAFAPALNHLTQMAGAMNKVPVLALPESEEALSDAAFEIGAAVAAYSEDDLPSVEGAQIDMMMTGAQSSGASTGSVQNGAATPAPALLNDVMPEPFQPEPEEAEEENHEGAQSDSGHTDAPAPLGADSAGHSVTTGGNLLVNEALVTTNWLDAPLWLVSGNMLDLNTISQTVVLSDGDTGLAANPAAQTANTAVNLASFTTLDNAPSAPPDYGLEELGFEDAPYVEVLTIEGNLLNFTHVSQTNLVSDNDTVSFEFTGAETLIQTGGNTLLNLADMLTLGFYYDVIIVGGNVIDMTMINQVNVLLDGDHVTASAGFAGEVIGGGNLAWNQAVISEAGVNTTQAMEDDMVAALGELGADAPLSDAAVNTLGLEGHDIVRVLHIEGDVINVTSIDQTNVLGDADQIALMAETMLSELGSDVTVHTGENALINVAGVSHGGIDSDIHVGGHSYSDALLYQAEFIDTSPIEHPTDTAGLASEAVAFLSDDMAAGGTGPQGDDAPQTLSIDSMNSSQADVMHIT